MGSLPFQSLTTGTFNSAFGFESLCLTDGAASFNMCRRRTLLSNTETNTALGAGTLLQSTMGARNTAVGAGA